MRWAMGALCGAGFLALALVGPVGAGAALVGAGVVLLAPAVRPWTRGLPWPLVTFPMMVGLVGWVARGAAPHDALAVALAYLQAQRRLARASVDDDRVSALLAGLMVVAAASRTEHPWFLLAAGLYAGSLSWVLLPPRTPARPFAAIPVVVLLTSALLFPILPRRDGGLPARPEGVARTGFAADVSLGAMDALRDDPTEVLRVTVHPPVDGPIYLRGIALDQFDGARWWRATPPSRTAWQAQDPDAGLVSIRVRAQPNAQGAVFTTGEVARLDVEGRALLRDAHGAWSLAETMEGALDYGLLTRAPLGPGGVVGTDGASTVALPDLDPRVRALAEAVAPEETDPVVLAEALAAWLRARHPYGRAPGITEHPLETFLLEGREGHCGYFATALAVLLRVRGVPTRVVNGFAGGDPDPVTGQRVFRRAHAHTWVEVRTPDGWRTMDATPGPVEASHRTPVSATLSFWWEDRVLRWDADAQRAALRTAGQRVERGLRLPTWPGVPWRGLALLALLGVGIGAAARWGARRFVQTLAGPGGRAPDGPVARHHRRARRHVEASGWRIPESLPPVDAARWLGRRAPGREAAALEELAWLLYAVRYGGAPEAPEAERARVLAERVMQLPPRHANP